MESVFDARSLPKILISQTEQNYFKNINKEVDKSIMSMHLFQKNLKISN